MLRVRVPPFPIEGGEKKRGEKGVRKIHSRKGMSKLKLSKMHLVLPLRTGEAKTKVQKDRALRKEVGQRAAHRSKLRAVSKDRRRSRRERQDARARLQQRGEKGALVQVRNRCLRSGKGRGMGVKQGKVSNVTLRQLARQGGISGIVKV